MKADKDRNGFDTTSTGEMFCPYCGESQPDAWEYSKDSGSAECESCGAEFSYERETISYYSTEKIEKPKP